MFALICFLSKCYLDYESLTKLRTAGWSGGWASSTEIVPGLRATYFFHQPKLRSSTLFLRGSGPCVNVSGEAVSGQNSQGQDGGVAASEVYDLHQTSHWSQTTTRFPRILEHFSATHDARLAFTLRSRNRINARNFFSLAFPLRRRFEFATRSKLRSIFFVKTYVKFQTCRGAQEDQSRAHEQKNRWYRGSLALRS